MTKVGRPKNSGNYPKRINLYISEGMNEKLIEIAGEYNVSLAKLIRESMKKVIEANE